MKSLSSILKSSSTQELKQRIELLDKLLGSLLHETANPLYSMDSSLSKLIERQNGFNYNRSTEEVLLRLEMDLQRLKTLYRSHVELYQMRSMDPSNRIESLGEPSYVNIRTVLETIRLIHLELTNDQRITVDTTGVLDAHVKVHKNELTECLSNIYQNSIEASEAGIVKKISISTKIKSKHLEIRISDNGRGLSQDLISQAFEPGYSTKPKGGMGFGLYVSKTIAENTLNGKLSVVSYANPTCFSLEIPLNLR